ncbi:MAG: hypothetical protein M1816_003856 [Peltula sp. TS41687]|nr:MAG: hypothetical protein M1816_003856 [Peltula sp. TS41687]
MVSAAFSLLSASLFLFASLSEAIPAPLIPLDLDIPVKQAIPKPQANNPQSEPQPYRGGQNSPNLLPFAPSTGPFGGSGYLQVYSLQPPQMLAGLGPQLGGKLADFGLASWKQNGWVDKARKWTKIKDEAEVFLGHTYENRAARIQTSDGHHCHDADSFQCNFLWNFKFWFPYEGMTLGSFHWAKEPPRDVRLAGSALMANPSDVAPVKVKLVWTRR